MHPASGVHLLKRCSAMIVHALQEASVVYIAIFKSANGMMRNPAARPRSGLNRLTAALQSRLPSLYGVNA
jgi:hypothetical protein